MVSLFSPSPFPARPALRASAAVAIVDNLWVGKFVARLAMSNRRGKQQVRLLREDWDGYCDDIFIIPIDRGRS